MIDLLFTLGIFGVWIWAQRVLLPKMGIHT
jgi:hypothetical protein